MGNLADVVRQLQDQKATIEGQLSKVNAAVVALHNLSGKGIARQSSGGRPARFMSAGARKRIAAAQKARWAKWRKQQKAA